MFLFESPMSSQKFELPQTNCLSFKDQECHTALDKPSGFKDSS